MTSQLRLKVVLPIAVLAVGGLGVGAFAFGKPPEGAQSSLLSQPSTPAATTPAETTATTPATKPKPKPKRPASPLQRALRANAVVVVLMYTPGSNVDELATLEARSGAEDAGAGFLAVDVSDEAEVKKLAIKYDIRNAPGLLFFKRGPRLANEIRGYADRTTVEQAAENVLP